MSRELKSLGWSKMVLIVAEVSWILVVLLGLSLPNVHQDEFHLSLHGAGTTETPSLPLSST